MNSQFLKQVFSNSDFLIDYEQFLGKNSYKYRKSIWDYRRRQQLKNRIPVWLDLKNV